MFYEAGVDGDRLKELTRDSNRLFDDPALHVEPIHRGKIARFARAWLSDDIDAVAEHTVRAGGPTVAARGIKTRGSQNSDRSLTYQNTRSSPGLRGGSYQPGAGRRGTTPRRGSR